MVSVPEFLAPDGVYRERYVFTTTQSNRFFNGRMDPDTADMQVSIRGAAFTSDPDLIFFEGETFTIPNPSAFPDGLQLLPGQNIIGVKSILSNGASTSTSTIDATLSLDADVGVEILAPSGVAIERFDGTVQLSVEGFDDENVSGYHFYASVSPGGGTVGYSRINVSLVISGEVEEVLSGLATLEVDATKALDDSGSPAADPMFLVVKGTQEGPIGTVHQTDYNEAVELGTTIDRFRVTTQVDSVRTRTTFSFVHDRQATFNSSVNPAIPNTSFTSISSEDPLYYVTTAVYFVETTEVESEFSVEVSGAPLIVTPNVGRFPAVSRQQIVRDATLSIFRSQPQISVVPGSTTRDTFIDPFSTESERMRFILDFIHNAQTFATLLRIDDPALSGTSLPVAQSAYKLALKQAFFLRTVEETQFLIDTAFDHRAANFGKGRRGGRRSRGEVTFFMRRRPTETQTLPIGQQVGAGGVTFRTTSAVQITPEGAGAFFDPATGRYSVSAFIQAGTPGKSGDLSRGQINQVINGPSGLSVTNLNRTFGGLDIESNRDLAVRSMRALSSADSGRLQGYVNTASEVAGVLQVNVVDGGHSLMFRDIDPDTGEHTGGKVDIWIRGENLARVTDSFAFSFEIVREVQFVSIGDPRNLKLRAVDTNLSEENPIIEVLDFPDIGFGIRNATTGEDFNLTDLEIVAFDTVQLSQTLNDPAAISLTDVLFGDYRYRTSDKHIFERQPAESIRSFVGEVSGTISPTVYDLFHPSSPLEFGKSSEAGDYIQVTEPLTDTGDTIPSGSPVVITGEEHVILDGIEYLDFLGSNPITLHVYNFDRSVEYIGPFSPSVNTGATPDFTIIEPDDSTVPLGILTTSSSNIASGDSILLDYEHDENFSVEYETNALVGITQEEVDVFRHITADVLVKEAIAVPVDLFGTVVVRKGASIPTVRADIRTNLTNLFNALVLGEPLRQSDVIEVIDSTTDVSYLVVPLAHMVRGDGAQVVREELPGDQETDFFFVEDWSTPTVDTYLLIAPLDSATSDGGGPINEFRGVFRNSVTLIHIDQPPNFNGVPLRNKADSEFIIGNGGLLIPGWSDEATLRAESPFATDEQIDDRRVEISASRVLFTVQKGEKPIGSQFEVTYIVQGDSGVKNIEPGPVSYLTLGNIDFTFDEDKNFQALVTGR